MALFLIDFKIATLNFNSNNKSTKNLTITIGFLNDLLNRDRFNFKEML